MPDGPAQLLACACVRGRVLHCKGAQRAAQRPSSPPHRSRPCTQRGSYIFLFGGEYANLTTDKVHVYKDLFR